MKYKLININKHKKNEFNEKNHKIKNINNNIIYLYSIKIMLDHIHLK